MITFASPTLRGGERRRAVVPPALPAAYSSLYAQLGADLSAAQSQLAALHPESKAQPLYAAELLPANANRGTDLLQPGVIIGVRAYLDALQGLGVRGVVFALGYPLLLDRYPNSAQYLDFYKQVMAESRKRGMTVDIESSVIFANSAFSTVSWDYSKTTFPQFLQDRHEMAAKIVSQLAPDYLDLGAEPDTEAKLTGFTQLANATVWSQSIGSIISGIDRGATKIGTGVGTWSSAGMVDAEASQPIDFISLHIYPVDARSIATAFQAAAAARAHGLPLIIDEAWLFKMYDGESTSIADDTAIFGRDAYSFFAPLDQQFLRVLDDFARTQGVSFISPFWTTYFFSYIPYDASTASLQYADIVKQVNAAASANIVARRYSPTGTYYGQLIAARGR